MNKAQDLILTMPHERRGCLRYKIDCPITVLTPGRGKKRVIGCGWLFDISNKGARFILDHPLEVGARISLEVDFKHPDGEITTIRYPGVVNRVSEGDSYEIAAFFLKGESYIRGKGSKGESKEFPRERFTKSSRWIN
jgi:PilZ domain